MKTFWPSLGICLGIFVVAMDWAIVNNALPRIQRDLGASLAELQWIVNAFGLVMSVTMVTMGRLADAYGRRRLFMLGLLICAFSSLGAALSPRAAWLIGFRSFQGLSNAMVITCQHRFNFDPPFIKTTGRKLTHLYKKFHSDGILRCPSAPASV